MCSIRTQAVRSSFGSCRLEPGPALPSPCHALVNLRVLFFATAAAVAPHLCRALQSRSEHAEGVQRRAAQSRSQLARHRQSHPSDPAARGGPAAAAYFGALRGSARSAAAAANFRRAVRFPAGGRLCWRSSKRVSLRGAPCGARAQAAEALLASNLDGFSGT